MTVWLQNPFDNLPLEGYRKQRYWMMAEAFVRAGHSVVLWTSDFNHTTKRPRDLKGRVGTESVLRVSERFEIRLVPTRPYAANVSFARLISHRAYAKALLRTGSAEERKRPDLIVTSIPTVSGAAAAAALAQTFGARLVVDIQDAWPETFERLMPRQLSLLTKVLLAPMRWWAQKLYHEADVLTGVCERYRLLSDREDYRRYYLGVELENGADRVRTPPSAPVLVYAGNLGVSYDLGTVIRGMEGGELHIAGKGAGEAKWKALAKVLGKERQVFFHGYLDEKALKKLLAKANVGVVPLQDDSFVGVPNKFCEYAASGLAIVSSLTGESADLLKRYGCGATYRSGDERSFAEAVRRAVACPIGASRKMAESEFDAVRLYDDYVREAVRR